MLPKISIITPSFNQDKFIEETIKSVLSQDYQNIEHIVIDGGSTDNTLEILKKYPHLKIMIEPGKGQAEAINKGLQIASGEIIGWINSDDTYYPKIFQQVVKVINHASGTFVAMGRCTYINEAGKPIGKEHPSSFVNHRRVVKIWKGYTIPQPAVFFHRVVYEKCGGLDEGLYFAMDYDLFLRYTNHFDIYTVNQLWATYRLHTNSKTSEISQGELLEKSIEVSKRYWGPRYSISYWGYLFSYLLYGGKIGVTSLKRLNLAEKSFNEKNRLEFLWNFLLSFLLFPPTIFRYLILPRLRTVIGIRG